MLDGTASCRGAVFGALRYHKKVKLPVPPSVTPFTWVSVTVIDPSGVQNFCGNTEVESVNTGGATLMSVVARELWQPVVWSVAVNV